MKKEYRIKKYSEIDAVYKKKKAKHNDYFGVYQADDALLSHFRYAVSIGKKYGNAVERNLIKRRIRVIVSEYAKHIQTHKNILIVIKPQAKVLSYQDIKVMLVDLLTKSKLLEIKNAKEF